MTEMPTRRSRILIAASVVMAVAVIAAISLLAVSTMRSARHSAWRYHRFQRLQSATYGFYQRGGGWLPQAVTKDTSGNVLYGWRFSLIPSLDQYCPKGNWEKPWNAPENREAIECGNGFYWFSYLFDGSSPDRERCHSNMVVVTGPGTAFEEGKQYRYRDLPGNLILVVEVADSGDHWAAPGDLSIDQLPSTLAEGLDGDGFHVAFADHAVWFLRPDTPMTVLRRLMTIDGARQANREELLGPYGEAVQLP